MDFLTMKPNLIFFFLGGGGVEGCGARVIELC